MKIIFLHRAPLWGSGSGTYVRKLAEELSKTDKIAIICPENRDLSKAKIYNVQTPFPGVFYSHPDFPKAKKYSEMTGIELTEYIDSYLITSIKAIEQFKPDVIHVQHASFLVWIADYIKSIYNIPFVVTIHGPDLNTAIRDKRIRTLTKNSLKRASKILPNSLDTKFRFYELFGEGYRRKTKTIFPGVDLIQFSKPLNLAAFDKKYSLKGKRLVIYVGRLDKEKGIEYLIKAAKDIQAEIFILGGGDYQSELEKIVENLKLTNVHFLGYFGEGYVGELRRFYQRADVVVVPSIVKEALGLVILEAMAAKTPVVASNIGGIPNVVKEGKTGFLIKPRSSQEIAEKVNKILNNEKLRQSMRERCVKLIQEKFTWEKAAYNVRTCYQGVLKNTVEKNIIKSKKLIDYLEDYARIS